MLTVVAFSIVTVTSLTVAAAKPLVAAVVTL